MIRNHGLLAGVLVTALLMTLQTGDVRALTEGKGAGGEPYATGGIGSGERDVLLKRRQDFNVWVTTAAKKSGAYLADVRIKVVDAASRVVLETTLDGPLLFIGLKPGQYSVEATLEKQKQVRAVAVGAQGRHELHFYFDVEADTVPAESEANGGVPKQPAKSAAQKRAGR